MPSYKDEKTGKWYCSFYYTDLRGKRVRKMKRGFALKRDADKWEREFLMSDHPDEMTIGVLAKEYEVHLDNQVKIGNIKRSTAATYKNRIRLYILPYFKDAVANLVQPKHISEWLANATKITHKPLKDNCRYYLTHPEKERKERRSSRTINSAKATLSSIFEFGKLNYGLLKNPVEDVKNLKPFSNDQRASFWTLEQYNIFRDRLTRKDMKVLFDTMYFAGLRIGEALALTPNDIFPDHIVVNKALVQITYNENYIDTPKTDSSVANVPIPNFLYEELMEFIAMSFGIKPTDIIFDVNEQTVRNHLDTKAHQLGLPIISPHNLRHSYVSNILDATNNIAVTASMARHANPNVTLRIYAHMIPESDKQAVEALEKMNPNKQKK